MFGYWALSNYGRNPVRALCVDLFQRTLLLLVL